MEGGGGLQGLGCGGPCPCVGGGTHCPFPHGGRSAADHPPAVPQSLRRRADGVSGGGGGGTERGGRGAQTYEWVVLSFGDDVGPLGGAERGAEERRALRGLAGEGRGGHRDLVRGRGRVGGGPVGRRRTRLRGPQPRQLRLSKEGAAGGPQTRRARDRRATDLRILRVPVKGCRSGRTGGGRTSKARSRSVCSGRRGLASGAAASGSASDALHTKGTGGGRPQGWGREGKWRRCCRHFGAMNAQTTGGGDN